MAVSSPAVPAFVCQLLGDACVRVRRACAQTRPQRAGAVSCHISSLIQSCFLAQLCGLQIVGHTHIAIPRTIPESSPARFSDEQSMSGASIKSPG